MTTDKVPVVMSYHPGALNMLKVNVRCVGKVRHHLAWWSRELKASNSIEALTAQNSAAFFEDATVRLQQHHSGVDGAVIVRTCRQLRARAHKVV